MSADAPTVAPCGCCRELIEIHTFGTNFDSDLQQYTCDPCRIQLRAAGAWLKAANIRHCRHTDPDIELRPLVA